MLKIYNTLTKQKEDFKPVHEGEVRMYVCGMTVYDYCHIGHGRIFVVFDMVARYLRYRGYKVTYVRNITDIDDKIINRANENNEPMEALTARMIEAMHEDERALGVEQPDKTPRATEHVDEIIKMVQTLIDKGFAYQAENGDVYFEVSKFEKYGHLAHQDLEHLKVGARVDVLDVKRDPLDFALWKVAKPDEPSWDSPWGAGRPGWHIECSAMSEECLGKEFDIHGGGLDLQFPHHQNEVAQSDAALDTQAVKTWMHAGFVNINEEKMSKSLNNFFTIREVLKQYHPEAVRYFMLASHYRSPINYADDNLDSAHFALQRFYSSLRDLPVEKEDKDMGDYEKRFTEAMDDDFNTPVAFSVLFDIARHINVLRRESKINEAAKYGALLKRLGGVLGFLQLEPQVFLHAGLSSEEVITIEQLIKERETARSEKDWATADALRDQLTQMHVRLEDNPEGTRWRRVVE